MLIRLPRRRDSLVFLAAVASVVAIAAAFRQTLHFTDPTTAALTYLLVVLIASALSNLWVAILTAVVADLCLNYFFMPPFGTLTIADAQNWVALFVFLAVAVIASRLSTAVRQRERESSARRAADELKSALLASLAHDLKTPLTAIRIAAGNLRASWPDEQDRREQADVILAEVERLNRLFQNILEMARIETGAISAELSWVHPAEILEAARDQVEHTLRRRRVEVQSPPDRLVRIDPRITASALAHLLENAAQYSAAESPIGVTMTISAEGLTISVRDRGPGIAPGDLPHVFERFYRGEEARRRTSSTGMGLSIARGMLAAEGGSIRAENCAGGGARFTMAVPAESRPAAPAEHV